MSDRDCNLNINLEDLYHSSPAMSMEEFLNSEFSKNQCNMPVSSKKSFDYTSEYPIMTEARQVFPIGQEFWYSPLVDPSVEILVCAKDVLRLNTKIGKEICEKHCCINKWCAENGNFDSVGENFIPECSNRDDGIDVYFELCQ